MSSLNRVVITDASLLTGIGFTATTLGHFLGRSVGVLQQTNFKYFVFSSLALGVSGVLGRELSLNVFERDQKNKKPFLRYASLSLGIAGMTAAATQKVSCFLFKWDGVPFKQNVFRAFLTAGSMCIFDYYLRLC